jgi:ABC-type transport system involved in cytochrome bd biosynthesis fused ATPase/permease subunit
VEKKGVSDMTHDQIEAGNKFLRDFVMLHNAMQAKIEQENRIRKVKADIAQAKAEWDAIGSQDTRRTKLEEIDRTWAAIQAIDTSGTVPR